jgi:hypothetical protein
MQLEQKHSARGCVLTVIALIAAASVAAGALLTLDPVTKAALFNQSGYIESGKMFGISIGSEKSVAMKQITIMSRGSDVIGPNSNNECLGRHLEGDEFIQVYDESWRGGTICVSFRGNVVHSILWRFNSLAI